MLDKQKILLSDTVGFIRDLPKELVEAFQATLEELKDADVLLQVVDASNPNYREQIKAVEMILVQIKVEQKPMIYAVSYTHLIMSAASWRKSKSSVSSSAATARKTVSNKRRWSAIPMLGNHLC